jgi:hypothetical protein
MWLGKSMLSAQNSGENRPDLPPLQVWSDMRAIGFQIERETPKNRFYPTQGSNFLMSSDFFSEELGSTFTFQRYEMKFDSYHSISKKQVFAYDLYACSVGGNPPFYAECVFGVQNELRGYPAGRYIDRKMLATQGEYRLTLPWHLGLAAFGGLGEVAPTLSDFRARDVLGSIGFGPRLNLNSKYHVNLRVDFAWGKNGRTFSMGLGEAF